MARAAANKQRAASEASSSRRHREATAALVAIIGAQTVIDYAATYLIKEPMYDSVFTGAAWIEELLHGHTMWFYDAFGMAKPVFIQLCHELQEHCGLQSSKRLGLAEKLAIFLRVCRMRGSHQEIRERFQHASGTISMYVHIYLFDRKTERETEFLGRYST